MPDKKKKSYALNLLSKSNSNIIKNSIYGNMTDNDNSDDAKVVDNHPIKTEEEDINETDMDKNIESIDYSYLNNKDSMRQFYDDIISTVGMLVVSGRPIDSKFNDLYKYILTAK